MQIRGPFEHSDFDDPPRGMTRALLMAMAASTAIVIGFFYLLWRLI